MTTKLKRLLIVGVIALLIIVAVVCLLLGQSNTPSQPEVPSMPEGCKHEESKLEIFPAKDPTCLETGLSEGKKCTECGEILVQQITLEKAPCSESDWIIDKPATEHENGSKHTKCTVCNKTLNEGIAYALGTSALLYTENPDGTYSVTGISDMTLTFVTVPKYYNDKLVTKIGKKAFYNIANTPKIETIVLPNSIISIEDSAFAMCSNLKNITIPASVEEIGMGAFGGCHVLKAINVDDKNNHFSSVDGNLYNKSKDTLLAYASGKSDSVFIAPENLTAIGAQAFFSCDNIIKIELHKNVSNIHEEAFYNVTSLKEFVVDTQNVHYKSLDGNLYTKDEKVLIQYAISKENDSFIMPANVERIGRNAFIGAVKLQSITFSDKVTAISTDLFSSCDRLSEIKLGKSVSDINPMAFYLLPITNLEIHKDNPHYKSIDSVIYSKDGKTLVFYPCSKQDTVFEVLEGVHTILAKAFNSDRRSQLKVIKLPESINTIEIAAFLGLSNVEKIDIDSANKTYAVSDGVLYTKDFKKLVYYPVAKSNLSYTVPNGVETIVMYSFYYNRNIKILTLPSTIKNVNLSYCNNLKTINYNGTKDQWNKIIKDIQISSYTVHCTDGDV